MALRGQKCRAETSWNITQATKSIKRAFHHSYHSHKEIIVAILLGNLILFHSPGIKGCLETLGVSVWVVMLKLMLPHLLLFSLATVLILDAS